MQQHSYLNPKCEVRKSSIHGLGVFAKEKIYAGELAMVFGGCIITNQEAQELPPEVFFDLLEIYDGIYLGVRTVEELEGAQRMNHGCSPNVGVKGQNVFLARQDIEVGQELSFDYETTELPDGDWYIKCTCGSLECRKEIRGESWKNPEFQMKNAGYFSWYLEEKIKQYNQQQVVQALLAQPLHL